METNTHSCLRCKDTYQDSDPDPYYCLSCREYRKELAQKVDAQIAARGPKRETYSALKEYESADKVGGFMKVKI